MGSNSFGKLFTLTTWGESHGPAIGVVVDGCPAGLPLCEADIASALLRRRPGKSPYTSPRKESDQPKILSGIFEGVTTGAPIAILIPNQDADSTKYEPIKDLLRPGHAHFTFLEKYGIFDYRGGGRASARETAARVAAGAIARKLLEHQGIQLVAYLKTIGPIEAELPQDFDLLTKAVSHDALFCPDSEASVKMAQALEKAIEEGDSLGGIVECHCHNLSTGLGDPVYEKLEANLAKAMMSLPATKGFEIGAGFLAARMKGSEHNDLFIMQEGKIATKSNHAGGTLGGISTGMPLIFRVAFKPTSTIRKNQPTLNVEGEERLLELPEGSRHDPCVAIRAVPVVEAMTALVLADAWLMNRIARI